MASVVIFVGVHKFTPTIANFSRYAAPSIGAFIGISPLGMPHVVKRDKEVPKDNPSNCEKRRKQAASGGFLLDTFLCPHKENCLVRGYENPHSNTRRVSDNLYFHIPVFWIPASGASSYLPAALPPSLAVVHTGMTLNDFMQVDSL